MEKKAKLKSKNLYNSEESLESDLEPIIKKVPKFSETTIPQEHKVIKKDALKPAKTFFTKDNSLTHKRLIVVLENL